MSLSNRKSNVTPFLSSTAKIMIDRQTLAEYRYLVSKVAPNEVQWFCTVDRYVANQANAASPIPRADYTYWIEGLYIPEQEVSGAEVDTDPVQMYKLMQELRAEHRIVDEAGDDLGPDNEAVNDIVSRMHVWCHSHPFTSDTPGPSSQDERNFRKWIEGNLKQSLDTPVIMLIFGKGEDIYARAYDPQLPGIVFNNVPIRIVDPESDFKFIDTAISAKITKAAKYVSRWTGPSRHNRASLTRSSVRPTFVVESVKKTPTIPDEEEEAFKTFLKAFDGGHQAFRELISRMNSSRDNSTEVRKWKIMMDKWLKSPQEWCVFHSALWGQDAELGSICNKIPKMTDDQILTMVLEELSTSILSLAEAQDALTFTKKFFKTSGSKQEAHLEDYIDHRRFKASAFVSAVYETVADDDDISNWLSNSYGGSDGYGSVSKFSS